MANKVCNFSDLIQRVTSSCLLNPLSPLHEHRDFSDNSADHGGDDDVETSQEEEEEEELKESGLAALSEKKRSLKRVVEIESLMGEIFESVSALKKSYISLQDAHCPWDPKKMSVADVAVVAELRRLGRLKERYRRIRSGGRLGFAPLREAVLPYEAAVDELKEEVKSKEAEVENLKEKLRSVSGKKGKFQSKRKVQCSQLHVAAAPVPVPVPVPVPEMYEAAMAQFKEASKSFTSLLLSLMRAARWDISAAVRSIETANATENAPSATETTTAHHAAKYALESYVSLKLFHGFDHETFYIDGSLSSLLNPDQFRRDSFTQFQDMKSMDPTELLGISPQCHFGKFCFKKYLSVIHPKTEESLFGNLDQHGLVSDGKQHPRSEFYGEFLKVSKAVWLLHLLAFAFNPTPTLFIAAKGAEYQGEFMESVVRGSGGGGSRVVGFPVSPGFKFGNGLIIKARVYLVGTK